MTTLSISQAIGNHNACTYHGYLNFNESEYDWIHQEIADCELPDIDYSDFDVGNYQKWLDDMPEVINEYLRPILEPALKKYGFTIKGFSFYQPKQYNFGGDSIDIEFSHDGSKIKHLLSKEIDEYFANVRQSSSDGYMSLEPCNEDDLTTDDYGMLWAILKKEDLIDTLNSAINDDIIPDACNDYQVFFSESVEKFARERDPKFFELRAQQENNQVIPFNQ